VGDLAEYLTCHAAPNPPECREDDVSARAKRSLVANMSLLVSGGSPGKLASGEGTALAKFLSGFSSSP
jgi:hypothetical protein